MADRAAFLLKFPNFSQIDGVAGPGDIIDEALAAAALEIDLDVWGAKSDQGQLYLAAHKLALSPFGINAKMVDNGKGPHGETSYGRHYDSLVRQVGSGYRVT